MNMLGVPKYTVNSDEADGPRVHHGRSVFLGAVLKVQVAFSNGPCPPRGQFRTLLTDSPPGHCGQSAKYFPDCLCPLLFELFFRVGLSWGLFLGLVGRLWLHDLDKLVWESLVVNLGHRPSSLFGEEFLSAPIHSPLSGRLIGPSKGRQADGFRWAGGLSASLG
jgi:hypothetical protein